MDLLTSYILIIIANIEKGFNRNFERERERERERLSQKATGERQ